MMKASAYFLSTLLLSTVLGNAAGQSPQTTPAKAGVNAKGETLAATVGKEQVTQAEIIAEMQKMFGPQILEERAKSPQQFAQVYALFRDQIVGMKLVTQAAEKQATKLEAQADVKEKIEKAREQILIGALTSEYVKNKVTDTALQEAFGKYPQEQIFLRHIIVNDEATAKAVIKALQGGASWGKLAADKSIDKQTAKDDGRLPPLLESQLPPVIMEAIKGLKPGAFTEKPIAVAGKWEVLYLDKRQKATFEEAKPALADMLSRQAFQTLVMDLKNKTDVQLYDAAGQPTKEVSPVFSMPNAAPGGAPVIPGVK